MEASPAARDLSMVASDPLFLRHIDRSGGPAACWPWLGCLKHGYGRVRRNDIGAALAHRIVASGVHGQLTREQFVCHRCDNRRCCNPAHLFIGSSADNARDRHAKGRDARGHSNGKIVLATEVACEILDRAATETVACIALALGLNYSTVHDVVTGRTWSHLGKIERRARGSRGAKITSVQAAEIRARRDEPRAVLAAEFGLSKNHVGRIALGHAWPARAELRRAA